MPAEAEGRQTHGDLTTLKMCIDTPLSGYPANSSHSNNAGLMLGQRRRRWSNIKPALERCIMFHGSVCVQLAVSAYPRPWVDVFALPQKNQHGGD